MRIEQMRQLVELAKYKSLNIASQNMHITQQALSVSVKKMEEELETELLVRTSHGVHLTESGIHFAQGFNKILAEYDLLLSNSKKSEPNAQQPIQVLVSYGAMEAFLAEVLSNYLCRGPISKVHVAEASYTEVIERISNGEVDLGINMFSGEVESKNTYQGITTIPLFKSPLFIRVSEKSPLAEYSLVSLEDLKDETILVYNNQAWQQSYMRETLDTLGKNIKYTVEENYQMHLNMIRNGIAIAFGVMGGKFFRQESGIKYIKIKEPIEVSAVCLHRTNKSLSPEQQFFINYLQIECNK